MSRKLRTSSSIRHPWLLHNAKMRCSLSCAAICATGVPMARAFVPAGLLQPMLQPMRSCAVQSLRTQGTAMTKQSDGSSSSSSSSSGQNGSKTYRVVFLRHGESTWNRDDRHIGWTDVPLTERGESEARAAGQALRREGFEFDVVYASMLKRVLKTEHIVMDELDQLWVPEVKDWRLNERHYGDLIGKTKPEAQEAFGAENVAFWASSYDVPPHPMSTTGRYYPKDDRRYQHVVDEDGICAIPTTECMKDVSRRVVGYWEEEIVPAVRSGKRVLVAGHANMLKTLLQHLDGIPDSVVVGMKVPRATPMVYELGEDMRPLRPADPAKVLSAEVMAVGNGSVRVEAQDEVNAF